MPSSFKVPTLLSSWEKDEANQILNQLSLQSPDPEKRLDWDSETQTKEKMLPLRSGCHRAKGSGFKAESKLVRYSRWEIGDNAHCGKISELMETWPQVT